MGFSEDQLLALTPRKYWLYLIQHREQQRTFQWLTGVIASAVANFGFRAPENMVEPKDFALPLLQKRERSKRRNRKLDEMRLRSYFARKAHHAGVIRIKGGPE